MKSIALFIAFACVATIFTAKDCSRKVLHYFDRELEMCLPILTDTCSEEAKNRFESMRDCERRHIAIDRLFCAANSAPVKRSNGESHCYTQDDPTIVPAGPCPAGSTCMMGFRVGVCCNSTIEAEFSKNQEAPCTGSKAAVKRTDNEFNVKLFGKTCGHHFCPSGSECVQGKYLAYCCE